MRVSGVVQYLAFGSVVLSPWLALLGVVSTQTMWQFIGGWAAIGIVASIWHRNVEESK